jgi:inhibitor of cysteine peptidase
MKSIMAAMLLLAFAIPLSAAAATQYDRTPPGQIVQTANFNFIGSESNGLYAAVVSRTLLAKSGPNGKPQYQPYLTIYRQDPHSGVLAQIYQSPSAGDSLHVVPKRAAIPGTKNMWLPGVELSIIGTGQLMEPNTQQLVVSVYAYAADCGAVTMHVLRLDPKTQKLLDVLHVQNFCKLDGGIAGHSLLLSGPYYAANAALCCPTKNDAHATVTFDLTTRRWVIAPSYFKLTQASDVALLEPGAGVGSTEPATQMNCSLLRVGAGQTFSITLVANPTTGYAWQLDKKATSVGIAMVRSQYEPPSTQQMGAPGHETWTFKAPAKGTALLGLRYLRPFDKATVPTAKEAFFVVVVR